MNDLSQTILMWGGIAGALTALIALSVKIIKVVKIVIGFFNDLKQKVNTLVKHDKSQYMAILRLTIMSENIPLSERILAGKEYLEAGGNGDVRHFYETKLKPFDTVLKGENNG